MESGYCPQISFNSEFNDDNSNVADCENFNFDMWFANIINSTDASS